MLRYDEVQRLHQSWRAKKGGSLLQDIIHEVFLGFPEPKHMIRVLVRLLVAAVLGGLIGVERQVDGKRDSIRTHMLVSLGAALFTLIGAESLGEATGKPIDLTRIVQGVAAGVGFLGAGTILKLSDQHEVRGLTSAASIWLTAAVGMAVGSGWVWPAIVGVTFAWIILYALHRLECWGKKSKEKHEKATSVTVSAGPASVKVKSSSEGDD
jgi:putative Mg2+ transporter-C (MgtC) family protein